MSPTDNPQVVHAHAKTPPVAPSSSSTPSRGFYSWFESFGITNPISSTSTNLDNSEKNSTNKITEKLSIIGIADDNETLPELPVTSISESIVSSNNNNTLATNNQSTRQSYPKKDKIAMRLASLRNEPHK